LLIKAAGSGAGAQRDGVDADAARVHGGGLA
jgi:hypothetical protein